ncbi:TPA: helix-turn-helix transcriptional regulator [Streptococcus suis]|nr:helix-turn-helix transcriptional regulator [Streptococcus suis]HEP1836053.1 helix-turn-helix transcriptional regulator [Streptococcus suis]
MTLLASRLRSRRLELNLSQAELAEGVCEQGQISRIEKGKYNPGSDLLYKLSLKLNVSMNYFFDESASKESSNIENFKILSKKLLTGREYESLKYLYELELGKKQTLPLSDQLYLTWIESIILFHCDNWKTEAIKKLESVINKMTENDQEYFKYLNSLLNFYSLMGNKEISEKMYLTIISKMDSSIITDIEDLELLIKVRYNYCRYLWLENKIDIAITEILETIDICNTNNHCYLLADLYCLLGNVSEGFLEKVEVRRYFSYAQFLYNLYGNERMSLTLENYIKKNF